MGDPRFGPTQPLIQWISGLKAPGREVDHTHPSNAQVKNKQDCTSSYICFHGVQDNFTSFYLMPSKQKIYQPPEHSVWTAIVRYHYLSTYLDMFTKLQCATLSFVTSIWTFIHIYQLSSQWMDFSKTLFGNTITDCWMPPFLNSWPTACSFCLVHLLHLAEWLT